MNEPMRNSPPPTTGRGGNLKSLAMLATLSVVGMALYASSAWLPPASTTAVAGDEKPGNPTAHAVMAATKWLDALDANQRDQALYDFTSPKKPNWSNLPVSFVQRNGVELSAMTKDQRKLAMDVVAAVLSKGGYQKVVGIMEGDQKLAEGQGGKGKGPKGKDGKDKEFKDKDGKDKDGKGKGFKDKGGKGKDGKGMFGAEKYYLAIFGKPSATKPWMVQFGGHHLGINVTVIGKHFVLTPTHTGAQPAQFKSGGMEVRPLGLENDTAFKLVNDLDEKQRAQAIVGQKPQGELVLGPGRDGKAVPPPEGIKGSALTAKQQAMLLNLIGAWVDIVEPDAAKARMAEIKGNIGETYFSWRGPTTNGSAVYFRVQGPTVWIEYAPQGSTDHIHTVVRNPKDDYGSALIGQ